MGRSRKLGRRAALIGIGAAGAGMGAAAWPGWLRAAFGNHLAALSAGDHVPISPEVPTPEASPDLGAAARRASASGRPLLVLVIPSDDSQKWSRGHAFGEYLNHGSDAQLAPLAQADVLCATADDVRKLAPGARGNPLMFLLDVSSKPVKAQALDAALAEDEPQTRETDYEQRERVEAENVQKRIDAVARLVRTALGAVPAKLEAARAKEARERLVEQAPRGTRWATNHGCGTNIEGADDNFAVGCGMGHIPKESARFLYFYTDEERTL